MTAILDENDAKPVDSRTRWDASALNSPENAIMLRSGFSRMSRTPQVAVVDSGNAARAAFLYACRTRRALPGLGSRSQEQAMSQPTLSAEERTIAGKKVKNLRKQGLVPGCHLWPRPQGNRPGQRRREDLREVLPGPRSLHTASSSRPAARTIRSSFVTCSWSPCASTRCMSTSSPRTSRRKPPHRFP